MKNIFTKIGFALIYVPLLLCRNSRAVAQLPDCDSNFVYIAQGHNPYFYNWNPNLPFSATNPVLNTITLPSTFGIGGPIAVSENLNSATGPSPTFYSVNGGNFYYYNGTNWINTGDYIGNAYAVNIGAGGGYIYSYTFNPSPQVYRYDGTGNATLILIPSGTGYVADMAVDCQGNFYMVKCSTPQKVEKYNPNGTLLQSWDLLNCPVSAGGGGVAIRNGTLYFGVADALGSQSIYKAVINNAATALNAIQVVVPSQQLSGYNYSGDYASCEWSIGAISGGSDVLDTVTRGCTTVEINFHRDQVDSTPYPFHLVYSGTASNGVDYLLLPDTFWIPANQSDATLTINPLLINNAPDFTQAAINVMGPTCSNSDTVLRTISIVIQDSLGVKITTPPNTVCPNTPIAITAQIDSGLNYAWEPADSIPDPLPLGLTIHPIPTTTTIYSITATLPGASATCPAVTRYYTAAVEPNPVIYLADDTTVCLGGGDSMAISAYAEPDSLSFSWNWTPATHLRDDFSPDNQFFAAPGNYQYVVTAQSTVTHCKSSDTINIHVVTPFAFQSVSPADTTINYGDEIQLHAIGDAARWIWDPQDYLSNGSASAPYARPLEEMHYRVIGIGHYGCADTAFVNIRLAYHSALMIPNAFSPNGDGRNDVFKIINVQFERINEFSIFNRWGQRVFVSYDSNNGWDGTFNGKPSDVGVYHYLIRYTVPYPQKEQKVIKGDLTLIR